jgi:Fanconi-associated nuclease 1
LNCEAGIKSRFYGEDGAQCGVEQLALQYYAGEGGWQGVHTESGIWLTIFALLMWDIIFSDLPNVFRNRFQVWLVFKMYLLGFGMFCCKILMLKTSW